jgi:hypothetical protein
LWPEKRAAAISSVIPRSSPPRTAGCAARCRPARSARSGPCPCPSRPAAAADPGRAPSPQGCGLRAAPRRSARMCAESPDQLGRVLRPDPRGSIRASISRSAELLFESARRTPVRGRRRSLRATRESAPT